MRHAKRMLWATLAAGAIAGAFIVADRHRGEPLVINAGLCALVKPGDTTATDVPRKFKFRASDVGDPQVVTALFSALSPRSRSRDVDGEWVIRGQIDRSAADALRHRLAQAPVPTRLRISSGGGNERAAIDMADQIASHGLPVVVDAFCGSSCANYLLPASPQVQVEGIVLMHGSSASCAAQLGVWDGLQQVGLRGVWALHSAARRHDAFEQRHPHFKALVARSAPPDRGDPSGTPHVWRYVRPDELVAAHPALTVGAREAQSLAAYRALQRQAPGLLSDIYVP